VADLQSIQAMFYDTTTGRIYYTMAGQPQLYYRYFSTESNVIGALRYSGPGNLPGIDWTTVRGAFLSGSTLYYTTADGVLHTVQWSGNQPVGSVTDVSGPGIDGQDWRARGLFLFSG
jgi:hypothetical protein